MKQLGSLCLTLQEILFEGLLFKETIYNGPTNALVCNKILIQMSHIKTIKITPTCFRSSADHHQGAF
jgi:hypothetical protein